MSKQKKMKLTKLNKDELNKKQMNLTIGGRVAATCPCSGCLCNGDVSGQCSGNDARCHE